MPARRIIAVIAAVVVSAYSLPPYIGKGIHHYHYDPNSIPQNEKVLKLFVRLAAHTANRLIRLKTEPYAYADGYPGTTLYEDDIEIEDHYVPEDQDSGNGGSAPLSDDETVIVNDNGGIELNDRKSGEHGIETGDEHNAEDANEGSGNQEHATVVRANTGEVRRLSVEASTPEEGYDVTESPKREDVVEGNGEEPEKGTVPFGGDESPETETHDDKTNVEEPEGDLTTSDESTSARDTTKSEDTPGDDIPTPREASSSRSENADTTSVPELSDDGDVEIANRALFTVEKNDYVTHYNDHSTNVNNADTTVNNIGARGGPVVVSQDAGSKVRLASDKRFLSENAENARANVLNSGAGDGGAAVGFLYSKSSGRSFGTDDSKNENNAATHVFNVGARTGGSVLVDQNAGSRSEIGSSAAGYSGGSYARDDSVNGNNAATHVSNFGARAGGHVVVNQDAGSEGISGSFGSDHSANRNNALTRVNNIGEHAGDSVVVGQSAVSEHASGASVDSDAALRVDHGWADVTSTGNGAGSDVSSHRMSGTVEKHLVAALPIQKIVEPGQYSTEKVGEVKIKILPGRGEELGIRKEQFHEMKHHAAEAVKWEGSRTEHTAGYSYGHDRHLTTGQVRALESEATGTDRVHDSALTESGEHEVLRNVYRDNAAENIEGRSSVGSADATLTGRASSLGRDLSVNRNTARTDVTDVGSLTGNAVVVAQNAGSRHRILEGVSEINHLSGAGEARGRSENVLQGVERVGTSSGNERYVSQAGDVTSHENDPGRIKHRGGSIELEVKGTLRHSHRTDDTNGDLGYSYAKDKNDPVHAKQGLAHGAIDLVQHAAQNKVARVGGLLRDKVDFAANVLG